MQHRKRIVDQNNREGNIYDEPDIVSFWRHLDVGDNIFLQSREDREGKRQAPTRGRAALGHVFPKRRHAKTGGNGDSPSMANTQ